MFLQFLFANKDLRSSSTYRQYQQKLLKQKIINKTRRLKLVEKDLLSVKNELMCKLKWIDFHHVCNLFLTGNDKSISKHQHKNFISFLVLVEKRSHMIRKKLFTIFQNIN